MIYSNLSIISKTTVDLAETIHRRFLQGVQHVYFARSAGKFITTAQPLSAAVRPAAITIGYFSSPFCLCHCCTITSDRKRILTQKFRLIFCCVLSASLLADNSKSLYVHIAIDVVYYIYVISEVRPLSGLCIFPYSSQLAYHQLSLFTFNMTSYFSSLLQISYCHSRLLVFFHLRSLHCSRRFDIVQQEIFSHDI